jgi:mannose-6-phosphate isomerase-like protein (cupin superfamily)
MSDKNKSSTFPVKNINVALETFDTYWDPKIVAELNGQMVKVAKLKGEFVWHSHELEDELFLVLSGTLRIEVRGSTDIILERGDSVVIPRGVEHKPVADEEVHVLLFEPATTLNTGNVESARTKRHPDRISQTES